jgi:hypothetical protein
MWRFAKNEADFLHFGRALSFRSRVHVWLGSRLFTRMSNSARYLGRLRMPSSALMIRPRLRRRGCDIYVSTTELIAEIKLSGFMTHAAYDSSFSDARARSVRPSALGD